MLVVGFRDIYPKREDPFSILNCKTLLIYKNFRKTRRNSNGICSFVLQVTAIQTTNRKLVFTRTQISGHVEDVNSAYIGFMQLMYILRDDIVILSLKQ